MWQVQLKYLYQRAGAENSICWLDITTHSPFTKTTTNWGITIRVVETEPGLINKIAWDQCWRFLFWCLPVCPHAAVPAMFRGQSGASGLTSWEISTCYQTKLFGNGLHFAGQFNPDSGCWGEPAFPHDMEKDMIFSWYWHHQSMTL